VTAGRAPRCENNFSPDGRYAVVNPLTHRSKPNKGRRGTAHRAMRSGQISTRIALLFYYSAGERETISVPSMKTKNYCRARCKGTVDKTQLQPLYSWFTYRAANRELCCSLLRVMTLLKEMKHAHYRASNPQFRSVRH